MNLRCLHDLGLDIYSKKRIFYSFCLYTYYTVILSAILFYLLTFHVMGMPLPLIAENVAIIVLVKFFIFHFFNIRRISLTKSVNTYVLVKTALMSAASGVALIVMNRLRFLISDIPAGIFVLDAILTWGGLNVFYFIFSELFNLGKSKFTVITRNYQEHNAPDNRTLIFGTDYLSQALYKMICQSEYCTNTIVGFIDDDPRNIGLKMNGQRIYGPVAKAQSIVDNLGINSVVAVRTPENRDMLKALAEHMNGGPAEVIAIPSFLDFVLKDTSVSVMDGFSIDSVFAHSRKIMYTPTIVSQKLQP